LIHLNSSAGQLEKDQYVLGTGKLVPSPVAWLVNKKPIRLARIGLKDSGPSTKRSSLIVKITGAPMRDMIDWIIGTNETVLDVAIDGLVALVGASFLTGVLHVVIEAL
jgi:hypothetical protein